MNFGQFLKNFGGGNGELRDSDKGRPIALGVSAEYHAEVVSRCRTGLQNIREAGSQVMSRKLRMSTDELSVAVEQLIDRIQAEPSTISQARGLTGIIAMIGDTLEKYNKSFRVDDEKERSYRAKTIKLVNGLTTDFRQLLTGMDREVQIDLTALLKTLDRIRTRDFEPTSNLPDFSEKGEQQ